MNFFDCEHYCFNYHTKENGWCSGMVSSNGHTTWCTALPHKEDWDEVTGGDNEGIGAPYVSNYGLPACNQPHLNWSVHFMTPDDYLITSPCTYRSSEYSLKEPVYINEQKYDTIKYKRLDVEKEGYYLLGEGPPVYVVLLA